MVSRDGKNYSVYGIGVFPMFIYFFGKFFNSVFIVDWSFWTHEGAPHLKGTQGWSPLNIHLTQGGVPLYILKGIQGWSTLKNNKMTQEGALLYRLKGIQGWSTLKNSKMTFMIEMNIMQFAKTPKIEKNQNIMQFAKNNSLLGVELCIQILYDCYKILSAMVYKHNHILRKCQWLNLLLKCSLLHRNDFIYYI